MATHAILSPSSAHRWMLCPGAPHRERDMPNTSSDFADEGTAAHELAARCLLLATDAEAYAGQAYIFPDTGKVVEFDPDMRRFVQQYVDVVCAQVQKGELLVEQAVPIDHLTGEAGATGSADAIVLVGDELQVHDLKYGRGERVLVEKNYQLMLYTAGALSLFEALGDFTKFRIFIHQPRNGGTSEYAFDLAELGAFVAQVDDAASRALEIYNGKATPAYNPGEKQCKWCRAKGACRALAQFVADTVANDFVDLTKPVAPRLGGAMERVAVSDLSHLASILPALDLIEDFCKAARERARGEIKAGRTVDGWKLVAGKKGARKWTDEAAAEATLKSMRLKTDEMYTYKIITPTAAEKLLAKESPRRWTKLQELIGQEDNAPSLVPAVDPRPALAFSSADDFEAVQPETADDLV